MTRGTVCEDTCSFGFIAGSRALEKPNVEEYCHHAAHWNLITRIRLSSKENELFSSSRDGTIRKWLFSTDPTPCVNPAHVYADGSGAWVNDFLNFSRGATGEVVLGGFDNGMLKVFTSDEDYGDHDGWSHGAVSEGRRHQATAYTFKYGEHGNPVRKLVVIDHPKGKVAVVKGYEGASIFDIECTVEIGNMALSKKNEICVDNQPGDGLVPTLGIWSATYSSSESCLFMGGDDGTIYGTDLRDKGFNFIEFSGRRHRGVVRDMCMLGAHVLASSGSDKSVRLWDLRTRKEFEALSHHRRPIWSMTGWIEEGGHVRLSSGSSDGVVLSYKQEATNSRDSLRCYLVARNTDCSSVTSLCLSWDRDHLFQGSETGRLQILPLAEPGEGAPTWDTADSSRSRSQTMSAIEKSFSVSLMDLSEQKSSESSNLVAGPKLRDIPFVWLSPLHPATRTSSVCRAKLLSDQYHVIVKLQTREIQLWNLIERTIEVVWPAGKLTVSWDVFVEHVKAKESCAKSVKISWHLGFLMVEFIGCNEFEAVIAPSSYRRGLSALIINNTEILKVAIDFSSDMKIRLPTSPSGFRGISVAASIIVSCLSLCPELEKHVKNDEGLNKLISRKWKDIHNLVSLVPDSQAQNKPLEIGTLLSIQNTLMIPIPQFSRQMRDNVSEQSKQVSLSILAAFTLCSAQLITLWTQ